MILYLLKKNMKKILRLTEGELNKIVRNSIYKLLSEDVLGDNWHEKQDDVLNNYEAFKTQEDETEHNWSGQGEEDIDPSYYEDVDRDMYYHDLTDNELYNGYGW